MKNSGEINVCNINIGEAVKHCQAKKPNLASSTPFHLMCCAIALKSLWAARLTMKAKHPAHHHVSGGVRGMKSPLVKMFV